MLKSRFVDFISTGWRLLKKIGARGLLIFTVITGLLGFLADGYEYRTSVSVEVSNEHSLPDSDEVALVLSNNSVFDKENLSVRCTATKIITVAGESIYKNGSSTQMVNLASGEEAILRCPVSNGIPIVSMKAAELRIVLEYQGLFQRKKRAIERKLEPTREGSMDWVPRPSARAGIPLVPPIQPSDYTNASVRDGWALIQSGDFDAATGVLTRALEEAESEHGSDSPRVVGVLNDVAYVAWVQAGDHTSSDASRAQSAIDAARHLERAMSIVHRHEPVSMTAAYTASRLAAVYHILGCLHGSSEFMQAASVQGHRSVLIARECCEGKQIEEGVFLNNLAIVYWDANQLQKAEDLFLEALAVFESTGAQNSLNYSGTQAALFDLRDEIANGASLR